MHMLTGNNPVSDWNSEQKVDFVRQYEDVDLSLTTIMQYFNIKGTGQVHNIAKRLGCAMRVKKVCGGAARKTRLSLEDQIVAAKNHLADLERLAEEKRVHINRNRTEVVIHGLSVDPIETTIEQVEHFIKYGGLRMLRTLCPDAK